MTFSIISILRSCLILIILNSNSIVSKNENVCSSALAGVIYRPESCAYQYLNKLHKEFLMGSQLLFTPQAENFIYTFESTHQIKVKLVNAMGDTTNYYYQSKSSSAGQPVMYTDIARSYINFPGFVRQVSDSFFYFSFVVFSVNAEMFTVTLSMPLSQDPIFC